MPDRNTLQRSAAHLRVAVLVVLLLLFAIAAIALLGISFDGAVRVDTHAGEIGPVYARWTSFLSLALFAVALLRLAAMLKRIAAGDRFSRAVTRPFRDFALLLLLSSITALLLPAAMALGALHADGSRIELRLELRDAIFLVACLVLFLVARMLEQAARIEAELEEIV